MHEDGSLIDYKKEVTQFLSKLHASVDAEFGKEIRKVVLLAAKGFNRALDDRRNLYVKAAGSTKMANVRSCSLRTLSYLEEKQGSCLIRCSEKFLIACGICPDLFYHASIHI